MLSIIKLRKLTAMCLDTKMPALIAFLGNKKGRRMAALMGLVFYIVIADDIFLFRTL